MIFLYNNNARNRPDRCPCPWPVSPLEGCPARTWRSSHLSSGWASSSPPASSPARPPPTLQQLSLSRRDHPPPPPPTFRRENLIEDGPHLRAGCWHLPCLCESRDERFVVLHWAYLQKICRPKGGFKSQYLACLLTVLSFVLYKFCKVFLKKRRKLWEDLSCCETYNVSLMASY